MLVGLRSKTLNMRKGSRKQSSQTDAKLKQIKIYVTKTAINLIGEVNG